MGQEPQITQDAVGLAHCGGVGLGHFSHRLGLRVALERQFRFPQRDNRHDSRESRKALLYAGARPGTDRNN
jgi:hypothetical protein